MSTTQNTRLARGLQHLGIGIYLASRDGYEDNILPNGLQAGSPVEALDCPCGLYLNDSAAWLQPPDEITVRTTKSLTGKPGGKVVLSRRVDVRRPWDQSAQAGEAGLGLGR